VCRYDADVLEGWLAVLAALVPTLPPVGAVQVRESSGPIA
jgi:hypothetical protein